MSSPHKSSSISSQVKKPSFLVRFIKGTFFQIFVFFTTIILLGVGYAAWTTLDRNDAANGKPVTQTLMQGIIDNINDLNTRVTTVITNLSALTTRVTTLEVGQTTGGTVTGPLRWSSEYSGQNYNQAWNTCLALSPAGTWRLPTYHEIEHGRRITTGLFGINKNYWSTALFQNIPATGSFMLTWNSTLGYWSDCSEHDITSCTDFGNYNPNSYPMVFRCVSNS